MSEVIFMCGVPGSGKTTLRHKMPHAIFISTDDYIEAYARGTNKTYNEAFHMVYEDAEKYMYKELSNCIMDGVTVIIDRTHTTRKSRASMMNKCKAIAKQHNKKLEFSIYAIALDHARVHEVQEQRKKVGRAIPDNVLSSMIDSFTLPAADEGFSNIYICKNNLQNMSVEHIFGSQTY